MRAATVTSLITRTLGVRKNPAVARPIASPLQPSQHLPLQHTAKPHILVTRKTQQSFSSTLTSDPLRAKLSKFLDSTSRGHSTEKRASIPFGSTFVAVDNILLRDACTCRLCVDPSSRQKLFHTQDIPYFIRARRVSVNPTDNSIEIEWTTDFLGTGHISRYSVDDIKRLVSNRASVRSRFDDYNYVLWDKAIMRKDVQFVPFDEYMKNDETLLFTLQQLVAYGLVFLKDVPSGPEVVAKIAERVGTIRHTFYGRTWDVKSVPNAKNIAYSPLNLGLHMDLLYLECPPGLQFLHCLANSVTGGESYFADSFRAAELVRLKSPNAFFSLTTFPVNFRYHNDNHHFFYSRPTVVLDNYGYQQRKRIDHVNYSPPFQAPFDVPNMGIEGSTSQLRQFFHGLTMLGDVLRDYQNQFPLKLKESEVVIFNNRRVVHARKEFDAASGERWLKGTYVDGDVFKSRLRVLAEKYKKQPVDAHVHHSYIR